MTDEPTFDRDGYPTEATLDAIAQWECRNAADFEAAMDFAGAAWSYPDRWHKERDWRDQDWPSAPPKVRYEFSTVGWSGNESIVSAIERNVMLQTIGAYSWRRGGHYEYRFPQKA